MIRYKKIKLKDGSTIDEHRLIMQNHIGRKLDKNEVVHHINGNKLDNSIDNLMILSRSEHSKAHAIKDGIGMHINKNYPPRKHPSLSAYDDRGCRCDECRNIKNEKTKRNRKKKIARDLLNHTKDSHF